MFAFTAMSRTSNARLRRLQERDDSHPPCEAELVDRCPQVLPGDLWQNPRVNRTPDDVEAQRDADSAGGIGRCLQEEPMALPPGVRGNQPDPDHPRLRTRQTREFIQEQSLRGAWTETLRLTAL